MSLPRSTVVLSLLSALTALVLVVAGAATAAPAPGNDPIAIQRQLGQMVVKNAQLDEQLNQARQVLASKQQATRDAESRARQLQTQATQSQQQLGGTLTMRYEQGGFSATGALLESSDGADFLQSLGTIDALSSQQARAFTAAQQSAEQAAQAVKAAQQAEADTTRQLSAVAKSQDDLRKQIDAYTTQLHLLTGPQQAAYSRAINPAVAASTVKASPATGLSAAGAAKAAKAVAFALAQVGKAYVFGAAGPDAYDCSGLTMMSWQSAGVGLPHSAAGQYGYGTHVPADVADLQPGDLIFFYPPDIGHVTIYIGSGMMVSAPTEGEPVSVVPLSSYSNVLVGATRLVS